MRAAGQRDGCPVARFRHLEVVPARQRRPRVAKDEMRLGLHAACGPDRAARPCRLLDHLVGAAAVTDNIC